MLVTLAFEATHDQRHLHDPVQVAHVEAARELVHVAPKVPPIALDSSLANVPGSKGEEALNVSEIGRAGPGERKAGRPAVASHSRHGEINFPQGSPSPLVR